MAGGNNINRQACLVLLHVVQHDDRHELVAAVQGPHLANGRK